MTALLKFEPHRYPSGQTSGAPQPPSHAELLDAINDLAAQLRLLAERVQATSEQATTPVPVPPPNGAAQAPALVASPVSGDIMACIHDCIQNPPPDIRQADDGTLELLFDDTWISVAGLSRAPSSAVWIAETIDDDQYGPVVSLHTLPADSLTTADAMRHLTASGGGSSDYVAIEVWSYVMSDDSATPFIETRINDDDHLEVRVPDDPRMPRWCRAETVTRLPGSGVVVIETRDTEYGGGIQWHVRVFDAADMAA